MDEQVARDILRRLDRLERGAVKLRKGVVSALTPLSIQAGGELDNPYTDVASVGDTGFGINDDVVFLTAGHSLLALGRPGAGGIPAARVWRTTGQSITNNTITTIVFDAEGYDTDGLWDPGAGDRFTIQTPGVYSFKASMRFAAHATGYRQVTFLVNGTTYITSETRMAVTTAAVGTDVMVAADYKFAAADYVQVQVVQTSGGALSVTRVVDLSPLFTIHYAGTG